MRNFYHIFIGFTIMYVVGSLTDFEYFTNGGKLIGVPFASAIVGIGVGFFWEWFQSYKMMSFFDFKDVIRTGLGALLGGVLSIFFADSIPVIIICCSISFVLIVNDLIFMLKK
jgi:glycopeptide antibiotics resistance protein